MPINTVETVTLPLAAAEIV